MPLIPPTRFEFFVLSAQALETSDYADGCPVATVALESANTIGPLREVCAEAFQSWLSTLERALVESGIRYEAAKGLALFGLSAFEGAIALSRTLRSTEPLVASAEIVAGIIQSAQIEVVGEERG